MERAINLSALVLLLLLINPLPIIIPASGVEDMFCAGVGYNTGTHWGFGFKSMGASTIHRSKSRRATSWAVIWGMHHCPRLNRLWTSTGLEIFALKGKAADGTYKPLNGWLLLRVKKLKSSGKFVALALWALTDKKDTFGEFVILPKVSCTTSGKVTANNLFSCSATPINAPTNPNMFVFRGEGRDNMKEISVLWKADMSYCNAPEKFRFMMATNTDLWSDFPKGVTPNLHASPPVSDQDYGPLVYYTSYLYPSFYGAASPVKNMNQEIQCSSAQSVLSKQASWLKTVVSGGGTTWKGSGALDVPPKRPYYDQFIKRNNRGVLQLDNRVVVPRAACRSFGQEFRMFEGRCEKERYGASTRIVGKYDTPPRCLPGWKPPGLGGKFYPFVDTRAKDLQTKGCTCPKVPSKTTVTSVRVIDVEPQPYRTAEGAGCQINRTDQQYNELGLCKDSAAGRHIYIIRVWHAVTSLICVMVLVPMSCFVARYMKGEIPNVPPTNDPHIPVRPWYLAHIMLTLPMACMYLSSMCAINKQTEILGRSLGTFSSFHRTYGNVMMYIFAFLTVTGFLRPIHQVLRKVAIYVHVICGYTVYYGGVVLCILTYRIPASPFSYVSVLEPNFKNSFSHTGPRILMIWLGFDIFLHVGIHVFIVNYERSKLEVEVRFFDYFPIIFPRRMDCYHLRLSEEVKKLEQILEYMCYVKLALCIGGYFAVLLSVTMFKDDLNHGFGWMECTHNAKGEYVAGLIRNLTQEELLNQEFFCVDF